MKKLMVLACVVAFATVSQAAKLNWRVNTEAWTLQDGSKPALGTEMWLIDNDQSANIIAALQSSAKVDFSGDYQSAISGLAGVYAMLGTTDDAGQLAATKISNENLEDALITGKTYNFSTLLIDNVSSADTVYYNISAAYEDGYATDEESALDTASFSAGKFTDGTGWQVAQATSIPEPTSGLLLLLGVAGMALRRRRA